VVPQQDGGQRGIAKGILILATGEFTSWQAEGQARPLNSEHYGADGTIVFSKHAGPVLHSLAGRTGLFTFEEDGEGHYRQTIRVLNDGG
jgi:hypothetical protein